MQGSHSSILYWRIALKVQKISQIQPTEAASGEPTVPTSNVEASRASIQAQPKELRVFLMNTVSNAKNIPLSTPLTIFWLLALLSDR